MSARWVEEDAGRSPGAARSRRAQRGGAGPAARPDRAGPGRSGAGRARARDLRRGRRRAVRRVRRAPCVSLLEGPPGLRAHAGDRGLRPSDAWRRRRHPRGWAGHPVRLIEGRLPRSTAGRCSSTSSTGSRAAGSTTSSSCWAPTPRRRRTPSRGRRRRSCREPRPRTRPLELAGPGCCRGARRTTPAGGACSSPWAIAARRPRGHRWRC